MGVNGRNADPTFLASKVARVREAHVAPLNDFADAIADARGLPRSHIPYVDPDCGGIHARALVLLDNPSSKAEAGTGSGLLSLDNDDRTARHLREAYERSHVAWRDTVGWNVVPFPVAGRGSRPSERQEAVRWTKAFVRLCPNLEFVLLLGTNARDGWKRAALSSPKMVPGVTWPVPHCSMLGLNQPGARERFNDAVACLGTALNRPRHAV